GEVRSRPRRRTSLRLARCVGRGPVEGHRHRDQHVPAHRTQSHRVRLRDFVERSMNRCCALLAASLSVACARDSTSSQGVNSLESKDDRPLPGVVEDSPRFREQWRPTTVAVSYGRIDVAADTSSVAVRGRPLTSTSNPEFDPPRYESFADGDDRLFLAVTSCGEWCENLNVVIELLRSDGAWRMHGLGLALSTDDLTFLARHDCDPWLHPISGSLLLDVDGERNRDRVRCSLSFDADVDHMDGERLHVALIAAFEVPAKPTTRSVPRLVRSYADAAA